jgi:hypothetical protein
MHWGPRRSIAATATFVGDLAQPLADIIIQFAKRITLPRRPVDPEQPERRIRLTLVIGL